MMRRRYIVTGLAAILLILFGGLMLRRESSPETLMPPERRELAQAPAAGTTSGRVLPVPKPASLQPHPLEICGLGAVQPTSSDLFAINNYVDEHVRPAIKTWEAAMLASDSYRTRAAGAYMQLARSGLLAAVPRGCSSDDKACEQQQASAMSSFEQQRDDLVQMASETRDPVVYAVAARVCRMDVGLSAAGACQHLSVEQWTQIDPGNAVPWLLLAGKARSKNDSAGEAEAVDRAAAADRFDNYGFDLYAPAAQSFPPNVSPLEQAWFGIQLIGYEAAWPVPQYAAARAYCSTDALGDDRVRTRCNALAQLIVTKAQTILDLSMGLTLATRLKWPRPRLDRMRQEVDAMQMALFDDGAADEAWSCPRVRHYNEYFSQLSRMSEVEVAREAVGHSGVSIADLAQRYADKIAAMLPPAANPN
jgi:hypothetical protein